MSGCSFSFCGLMLDSSKALVLKFSLLDLTLVSQIYSPRFDSVEPQSSFPWLPDIQLLLDILVTPRDPACAKLKPVFFLFQVSISWIPVPVYAPAVLEFHTLLLQFSWLSFTSYSRVNGKRLCCVAGRPQTLIWSLTPVVSNLSTEPLTSHVAWSKWFKFSECQFLCLKSGGY